ncbi:ABC transporter permease subunit [Acuticoccus mangrovi]|uniref:ABC transporter permease subunit n=1 Tax=Acuticoccus mangrovi TaxID=2796142 RepID=A0A934IH43_9HYPH|nr:ABC transporter permease subunit [Acuticoccus mangrovi]MBJ3774886.1 ABC transporter permease subunit [Acuticoccus mangrovi]
MTDTAATAGNIPSGRAAGTGAAPLTTADGQPLKVALRRANRRARRNAMLLVAPLFLFLLFTYTIPIVQMMTRSVMNPEIAGYLPNTTEAIEDWDGEGLPGEAVFAAMVKDLNAGGRSTIGRVAARLNAELPGARSTMMGSMRAAEDLQAPFKEALIADDDDWGEQRIWRLIKRETRTLTPAYYLRALDFEYNQDGEVVARPPSMQVYRAIFWQTAWMSALITFLTILLGYPVAHLLATLPLKSANLLMILVLLPFWTSLLVRTSAWIVLLQQNGVVNELLVFLHIVDDDGRIRMIYNRIGTIVAMTHILLPFMILPLYSVMKTIPPSLTRAARSMGATPLRAHLTVYFPLTIPGLAAGVLLVFILAIGYYITPALVGGESGVFISNLIADRMTGSLSQLRLALALATILLVGVLVFYWLFNRLVGVERLKFG